MLSVPANLEGTLEKRYGPTWRTPAYLDKGADTGERVGSLLLGVNRRVWEIQHRRNACEAGSSGPCPVLRPLQQGPFGLDIEALRGEQCLPVSACQLLNRFALLPCHLPRSGGLQAAHQAVPPAGTHRPPHLNFALSGLLWEHLLHNVTPLSEQAAAGNGAQFCCWQVSLQIWIVVGIIFECQTGKPGTCRRVGLNRDCEMPLDKT